MNISKTKKTALFSFCFLLFFLSASSAVSLAVRADSASDAPVSPALSVLAEENPMAMAGIVGNSILFEADDFARALNLSSVDTVTVTQTPPTTDGELRVGSTVVNRGHTISSSDLSLLSYTANSDVRTSSFRFRVGNAPYELTCQLYLLDKLNYAPTLTHAPKTALEVSTHRNVTIFGTLPCYDPDGDQTIIEIVSYPENGILILEDRTTGAYRFTPSDGYSGKDSFTYVARDCYGNYSAAATVSLHVVKPSTSVLYTDLADHPSHHAALTMTEKGIMSGTQIGTANYFYPGLSVSRAEFTVMAMQSLGITDVTDSTPTVFADNDDIPASMRGYVATAYELGYVKGLYRDDTLCFEPNRSITRAEAAVMLGNMIDAATPTVKPVFSDSDSVPSWAASSLASLSSMGIIEAVDGNIAPTSEVTRADSAMILSKLISAIE